MNIKLTKEQVDKYIQKGRDFRSELEEERGNVLNSVSNQDLFDILAMLSSKKGDDSLVSCLYHYSSEERLIIETVKKELIKRNLGALIPSNLYRNLIIPDSLPSYGHCDVKI